MALLQRVLEGLHARAWSLGYDVLPVPRESRSLSGMQQEDVFRLHGVLQRALGQAPGAVDGTCPPWAGLVADALLLAERGQVSRSQFLQDVWVHRQSGGRPGWFLEIGGGDGRHLSNTYLLEVAFGWSGALCEPNPRFARAIRDLGRSRAVLFEHAVAETSGRTVHLLDSAERSAVVSGAAAGRVVPVTTIAPREVLERAGAPAVVDYLSVDTEGSEPEILRAFPWDAHHVRFLTVEHNHVPGRLAELDAILQPQGLRRVLSSWSSVDAWYVHEDEQQGDGPAGR